MLNALSDQERDVVYNHLAAMGTISPLLAENVAREFAEKIRQLQNAKTFDAQGGGHATPQGEQGSAAGAGLNAVLTLEPDQLYTLLKDEHPQRSEEPGSPGHCGCR